MTVPGGAEFVVGNTLKRLTKLNIHLGSLSHGSLSVGDKVEMWVDHERRSSLKSHHSATHLLHAALREQLGDHVTQKGSLVAPDRLRFDISHPKAISPDECVAVASDVNREIRRNTDVNTRLMTHDEAINVGATALFGEKYGDLVRVVSVSGVSMELCGGTGKLALAGL